MSHEIWLPVVGWEGVYEVSNLGRVKRIKRSPRSKWPVPRILSSVSKLLDYPLVVLVDGKHRPPASCKIAKLVAEAFIGPRPIGMEINHKDGDKWNSRSDNLEYCTHEDNMKHAASTGLIKFARGLNNGKCRLSDDDILEIRRLSFHGVMKKDIAKIFHIDDGYVSDIVNNKRRVL